MSRVVARRPGTPRAAAATVPIARRTVTDLALEALRERIVRGHYPDGAPLRQDALAAELGVSRIPVREALRQLEAEGLVSFSPHCGAIVSTLSLEEIEELFALRALIESDLLYRSIPRLTAEHRREAADVLGAYKLALDAGLVAEWGDLNWRFHSALLAPAGRGLALGVLQNLHHQSDRYMRAQLVLTHGAARADDEHRAILAAVAAGDRDIACASLARHIMDAGEVLIRFLRQQRGAPSTLESGS